MKRESLSWVPVSCGLTLAAIARFALPKALRDTPLQFGLEPGSGPRLRTSAILPQLINRVPDLVGATFVGFRFRSAIGRCSKELVGRVLRAYLLSFHTHCLAMVTGLEPATYDLTDRRSTD